MPKYKARHRLGFTLVELMIVVAIVGVLGTIGVPTFRRLIQKSKQSEAKVLLGSMYRLEAAFYGEFETYGNNFKLMGFELDGNPSYYSVGIPGDPICHPSIGAHIPQSTTPFAPGIIRKFPSYYAEEEIAVFMREGLAPNSGFCLKGAVKVSPAPQTYRMTASGVIAPGIPIDSPNAAETDQWAMNEMRQLSHVVDGMK